MPGEMDAHAAAGRWSPDHVHRGTVMPVEVHVYRGETTDRMAQVAREVERLDEDLRQDDGRAEIQVDAPAEPRNDGSEEPEITQAPGADRRAVGARMHVHDVGADRDVDRRRDARRRSGGEDAVSTEGEARPHDRVAERPPEPDCGAIVRGLVHELPGLARHAEETVLEASADVLRGPAHRRELEVVDHARAVHRDRGEAAARDEVHDQRIQTDLDRMRPHPENDRPPVPQRGREARDRGPEVPRGEDVGETVDQIAHPETGADGTTEGVRHDPARPAREWHGSYPGEIESGERPGSPPRTAHAGSPNRRRSTSSQITCPTRMC